MIFFVKKEGIKNILKKIPSNPGVYIYRDINKNIIYIGKAKNLKKRVNSYWQREEEIRLWKKDLLQKIAFIELKILKNEREALIMESNLIKKNKPKYNVLLKDDKNYFFIKITNEDFPRVSLVRESEILHSKTNLIFGPYVSSSNIKETFKLLQSIFKFRVCENMPKKPCLLYYINLCQGPCLINKLKSNKNIKKSFDNKKKISSFSYKYKETIKDLKLALRGEFTLLNKNIKLRMKKASEKKIFEEAAFWRDRLNDLAKISSDSKIYFKENKRYQENKKKIILVRENLPIKVLAQDLYSKRYFKRIEGYDISNFNHALTTGSMVVWKEGDFKGNNYRRFRIKLKINERDDLVSLTEVIERRIKHFPFMAQKYNRKKWEVPDLVVIDGGINQFKTVKSIFNKYNIFKLYPNIRVCSLAKKNEELYFFNPLKEEIKKIRIKNKPYYKIIAGVRDEAHRFAIKYHRLLKDKEFTKNLTQ